jgi:heptaprenyl diphosphate synthase
MGFNEGMGSSSVSAVTTEPRAADFLVRVRSLLEGSAAAFPLRDLRGLLLSPGAKLLRPRLVHAFGLEAGVSDETALAEVAAIAELLHAASLIHDDVVDASDERRGSPTLHRVVGPGVAVLAGDHLLARALMISARRGPAIVDAAARAMERMSAESVRELEWRSSNASAIEAMDLAPLRSLAAGKTGALFAFCMEAGPLLMNRTPQARQWHRAGIHLGVAFQLTDDLVDFTGGAGKPVGADLRERNSNALVTAAAGLGLLSAEFHAAVQASHWERACSLLLGTPAVDLVCSWIRTELESARIALGADADSPEIAALFKTLDPQNRPRTGAPS